jgi:hypothetical protein
MRNLTTALLLILFGSLYTYGQDFCGHIKYRYTYLLAKNNKDITAKKKGTKTEDFYICGNNFKVLFDGKLEDIFIGDSLTYFLVSRSDIGYLKADSSYGQSLPSYKNLKTNVSYKEKVYSTVENQETTYYFNNEVKINPLTFEKLKLFHWNKFFDATNGGLCLVSISRKKNLITVAEAVEVDVVDLSEKDFIPPAQYEIRRFVSFKVFD